MSSPAWQITSLRLIASRDWWPLGEALTHIDAAALRVLESKKLIVVGIKVYEGWRWFSPSKSQGGVVGPIGSDEWAHVMDPERREGEFPPRIRIAPEGRAFLDEADIAMECVQPAGADRIRSSLAEIQHLIDRALSLRPRPPSIDETLPPHAIQQGTFDELARSQSLGGQAVAPLTDEAFAKLGSLQRRVDPTGDPTISAALASLSTALEKLAKTLEVRDYRELTIAKAEYDACCMDVRDAVVHAPIEPQFGDQSSAAWSRLTWTGDVPELDGQSFPRVGVQAVSFLRKLQGARGDLVKGSEIEGRADRAYDSLPVELKAIIDKPDRGQTGYRMR